MLLDKFFCLILKENLLFMFLSFGCLYLGILSKQWVAGNFMQVSLG